MQTLELVLSFEIGGRPVGIDKRILVNQFCLVRKLSSEQFHFLGPLETNTLCLKQYKCPEEVICTSGSSHFNKLTISEMF